MVEVLLVELVILLGPMSRVRRAVYAQLIRVHAVAFQLHIMLHLVGVQRLLMMIGACSTALLSTWATHILRQVAEVVVLHHFNS